MGLHKLLQRQLNRTFLEANEIPDQLEHWQEFIDRIHKTYLENDNERYLLARSMDISSKELMSLNQRLEEANHIAGIGYWQYNRESGQLMWSKETYVIFEWPSKKGPPSYKEFMQMVHEDYREQLIKAVDDTFTKRENFRLEYRFNLSPDHHKWYRSISHIQPDANLLTGIVIDITKDKQIEEEIKQLNQRLLISARQAGMSEVATSILHNAGNILNSANVSLSILQESIMGSALNKLFKVIDLVQANIANLAEFLTTHAQGKLIGEYFLHLKSILAEELDKNKMEIKNLEGSIDYLKSVVSMQQTISGVAGIVEYINANEVIDTALKMVLVSNKKNITIIKEYEGNYFIWTDKSKLLQILINLLSNAQDAVNKSNNKKIIKIHVSEDAKNLIIKIIDDGIGIAEEDLSCIFSFGYTTKKTGHGFGLHSSALSAQDLKGNLSAESAGYEKGATFTLLLPKKKTKKNRGVFNE